MRIEDSTKNEICVIKEAVSTRQQQLYWSLNTTILVKSTGSTQLKLRSQQTGLAAVTDFLPNIKLCEVILSQLQENHN